MNNKKKDMRSLRRLIKSEIKAGKPVNQAASLAYSVLQKKQSANNQK